MKVCPNPDCPDIEYCDVPGEYLDSVETCPTCEATLEVVEAVLEKPEDDGSDPQEGKPLMARAAASDGFKLAGEISNAAIVPVVKSLLYSAGIKYFTRNDIQDLFGAGRLGTGYNMILGKIEFWVVWDDVEEAQEVLGDLRG